jgi:hypothetical protein
LRRHDQGGRSLEGRIYRRNNLICWFKANKWDISHPYLQAVLGGNVSRIKTLIEFVNKLSHGQDYNMLNMSRYILFRIANRIKYSSKDLDITNKNMGILSIAIRVKEQQALLATEQRLWDASCKSGSEVFEVSERPITKEDIKTAQIAYAVLSVSMRTTPYSHSVPMILMSLR